MKKSVGIFLFDGVEVMDFAGPFEVFSVASEIHDFSLFEVFTFSTNGAAISAVNGLSVNPDYNFTNCPKIDILIIPGGAGTRELLDDFKTLNWISERQLSVELTISICSGARMLGKLGLLDGKPYCTHHGVYNHLAEITPTGVPQKGKRFVKSTDSIYTSGGISAGIDLSFHILTLLHGTSCTRATADYMEYDLARANN